MDTQDGKEVYYTLDTAPEQCRFKMFKPRWKLECREIYALDLSDKEHGGESDAKSAYTIRHNKEWEGKEHEIRFMENYEEDGVNPQFRLVLSELDKKIDCPECQKWFVALEGFPIQFEAGITEKDKMVNKGKTFDKLLEKAGDAGFHRDYKEIKSKKELLEL